MARRVFGQLVALEVGISVAGQPVSGLTSRVLSSGGNVQA